MFTGSENAPEIIARFYSKEIAENPSCANEIMTKNLAMLQDFVDYVIEPLFEKKLEDANRDGYDEGYQDGYNEGYQDGYDEGYQTGWAEGIDEGYEAIEE